MKSTYRSGSVVAVLFLAAAGFTTVGATEISVRCDEHQDLSTAIRRAGVSRRQGAATWLRDSNSSLVVHVSGTCELKQPLNLRGRDGWDSVYLLGDDDRPAVLQAEFSSTDRAPILGFRDIEHVVVTNLEIHHSQGTFGIGMARIADAIIADVVVDIRMTGLLVSDGSRVEVRQSWLSNITISDSNVTVYNSEIGIQGPGSTILAARSGLRLDGTYVRHGDFSLALDAFSTAYMISSYVEADGVAVYLSNSSKLILAPPSRISGLVRASRQSFIGLAGDLGPEIIGDVELFDFSNASLGNVQGSVACVLGSDFVLRSGGAVEGTITNCPSQTTLTAPFGLQVPPEPLPGFMDPAKQ